jgi:predicted MFS family arabinose efflux permease
LLFFYSGFVVSTLLCGFAESYERLLAARMITGAFGGALGSIVFAITTDLFPLDEPHSRLAPERARVAAPTLA